MNSHFKAVLYSSYILFHEILFILLSETPSKNMTFQSMIMKVGKNRERLFQNTGSKCLAIGVRQRLLHDVISFSKFQSNTSRPKKQETMAKNFYKSNHLHFQEVKSNPLVNFSKFWIIYFLCDVIISKLGKKGPKLYIMYRG